MRRLFLAFSACLVALGVASFVPMQEPKLADAMVYVGMGEHAHGSGVHIGNGIVLTAAHVADDPDIGQNELSVTDSLGVKHSVEVLWVNHKYDVALLRVSDPAKIEARELSCRYLDLGEQLSFSGNPLDITDVTTFGKVANSSIRKIGPWAGVNVVSGQLIPGMSGGPTFDRDGYVVGINVGLATNGGMFGGGSYALSFIVPGRVLCNLMGR